MAFSEKVKREIFLKAKGKCERCGNKLCFNHHKEGEKDAWEAHHKVSVAAGEEVKIMLQMEKHYVLTVTKRLELTASIS